MKNEKGDGLDYEYRPIGSVPLMMDGMRFRNTVVANGTPVDAPTSIDPDGSEMYIASNDKMKIRICQNGLIAVSTGEDSLDQSDFDRFANFEEIFYHYTSGSYEGSGALLAVNGNETVIHNMGHCSCYGPTDEFDSTKLTFDLQTALTFDKIDPMTGLPRSQNDYDLIRWVSVVEAARSFHGK